ncbi:(2Fe-2S)-binding protein [Candidatus Entotheonella palauensis]|nr:(2Fe-2S)-binding protein [Candidatus Entotheonella palauensis]
MQQSPHSASHPARLRSTGTPIHVEVDGARVSAFAGDSIATVLMASGQRVLSASSADHPDRTLFCGMGLCHQCLVIVDGVRDVRACMTRVRPGMKITTHPATGDLG